MDDVINGAGRGLVELRLNSKNQHKKYFVEEDKCEVVAIPPISHIFRV